MENTYCLKCKAHTENLDGKLVDTANGKKMFKSKCQVCNSGKCKFVKK